MIRNKAGWVVHMLSTHKLKSAKPGVLFCIYSGSVRVQATVCK